MLALLRRARAAGRIALLALPIWVAGCYSPKIKEGTLACTADLRCPRGFVCRPEDHACYRSLADAASDEPDADGAAVDPRDALSEPQPGDGGGEPTGGSGGNGGTATGGRGGAATGGSGGSATGGRGGSGGAATGGRGGSGGAATGGRGGSGGAATGGNATGGRGGSALAGNGGNAATGGRGGSAGCGDGSCGPKSNGSPCAQASECASEHCIDNVCCNEACTDKCRACDIGPSPGTCMQVTSGPPRGGRGACAGSSPCGGSCISSPNACSYPGDAVMCRAASCVAGTSTMRAGCDSAGGCATAATASCGDFVCNPAGTACLTACASDNQCASPARPYCQDGACRASRSNGARCDAAAECASQHCVDGYCCNDACQISCQACDVAGHLGTCSPVPTGTPYGGRSPCGGKEACAGYCDGLPSGQCAFPDRSTSCACPIGTGTCDGAGGCQTLIGICL